MGLIAVVILGIISIDNESKKVKEINFFNKTETVSLGDKLDLTFEVLPKTAEFSSKDIEYIFDNNLLVAKKGDAYIAIDEGTVKATLVYKDKNYDQKTFVINPIFNQSISIGDIEVGKNLKQKINVTFIPGNTTYKEITYKVVDSDVAKIEDDTVVGLNEGTTNVVAISKDGKQTTFKINVIDIKPTEIKLDNLKDQYIINDKTKIKITSDPKEISDSTFVFESSNPSVINITEDGFLEAVGVGCSTISVIHSCGASTTKDVEVINELATSVKITDPGTIYKGDSVYIDATLSPTDAGNQVLKWSSSNRAIATIDEETGLFEALKSGIVTITVETTNGKKDTLKIEIKEEKTNYTNENSNKTSGSEKVSGKGTDTSTDDNQIVYIASSGNGYAYHRDPNCRYLRNGYTEITKAEAIAVGRTPCGSCYK